MADFQNQINVSQAPGVEGDFASSNLNKYSALDGPGGFVAGPAGVFAGRFGWANDSYADGLGGPAQVLNQAVGVSGVPTGFIRRDGQGLNTTFLSKATMFIPGGFGVTLFSEGDFWVRNNGSTQALRGQKCYASYADGTASFAATATPAGATSTSFTISAQTFSVTASVANDVMTVTAVGSGTLYPGSVLSSAAGSATIVSQLTSTAALGALGGAGTYKLNIGEQAVAPTTVTGTYGLLTLGGTIAGSFNIGDPLTGTSVAAGSTTTANASNGVSLTGAGGAGTYVTLTATASSGTITAATNVETKWICMTPGLAGEIVKITPQAQS